MKITDTHKLLQLEKKEGDDEMTNGRDFPEIPKSELTLRELLWFHHGCPNLCLYGDDGEMQCNSESHPSVGFIDFRRDSLNLLQWKLGNKEYRRMVSRPD